MSRFCKRAIIIVGYINMSLDCQMQNVFLLSAALIRPQLEYLLSRGTWPNSRVQKTAMWAVTSSEDVIDKEKTIRLTPPKRRKGWGGGGGKSNTNISWGVKENSSQYPYSKGHKVISFLEVHAFGKLSTNNWMLELVFKEHHRVPTVNLSFSKDFYHCHITIRLIYRISTQEELTKGH